MENHFIHPTISNSTPSINRTTEFNSEVFISKELWRKGEFIEWSLLPTVSEDLEKIQAINDFFAIHEGVHRNNFGFPPIYTKQYIRRVNPANLNISLNELKEIINIEKHGVLALDYTELVEDGFFLQTKNTTYYGIVLNGKVKELYIEQYNYYSHGEILAICKRYNLAFVNWLDRLILPNYLGERIKNRLINNLDFYIQSGDWYFIPEIINNLKIDGLRIDTNDFNIAIESNPNKYLVDKDNIKLIKNITVPYLIKTPPNKLYFFTDKGKIESLFNLGIMDFTLELIESNELEKTRKETFIDAVEINADEMCFSGFEFFYSKNKKWHIYNIPKNYLNKLK